MSLNKYMRESGIKSILTNKNNLLVVLLLVTTIGQVMGQKKQPFMGVLEYKITVRDTAMSSLIPDNRMIIYTNDTITRSENFTQQLGMQATIRHIEKNKSYLLLNTGFGKFAIQTDLSAQKGDTTRVSKYTFKKKCFKKKILGYRANRVLANHPNFEEPIEFLYLKNIDVKYNNTFEHLPGLPVRYSVYTTDATFDYELVRINEYKPNRDLFGVPSDYERVSFDDFLDRMLESQGGSKEIPE